MIFNLCIAWCLIALAASVCNKAETTPSPSCIKCDSPNVRTVIFKNSDINKECWGREEMALLYARRIMQEILPRTVPSDVVLVMEYFKLCLKTLQAEVSSKYAHSILLTAMADVIGGYLQSFGFPIVKAKYYEGTASYCITKQLNELLDTTKEVLSTDGGTWTKPIYVKRSAEIKPIVIPEPSTEACSCLITSYDMLSCQKDCESKPLLHIPLPFLDSAVHPYAIALPFRNRSLFSLVTKDSSNILVRYYIAAVQCLYRPTDELPRPKCKGERDNPALNQFNVDFNSWLLKVVVPHLHDEKWYAGFGSVRRIIETMNQQGIKSGETESGGDKDFSISIKEKESCKQTSIWFYMLCVLAFLLLFWICVCCILVCAKMCRRRSQSSICTCHTRTSSGRVVNTLLNLYEGSTNKNINYKSMGTTCRHFNQHPCHNYNEGSIASNSSNRLRR